MSHSRYKTFVINGIQYQFSGGFGVQLTSTERRRMDAGSVRVLRLPDGDWPIHVVDWEHFIYPSGRPSFSGKRVYKWALINDLNKSSDYMEKIERFNQQLLRL